MEKRERACKIEKKQTERDRYRENSRRERTVGERERETDRQKKNNRQ